jgi:hypothetical protein
MTSAQETHPEGVLDDEVPPDVPEDGGDDDGRDRPDRSDWITVATFWSAPEAHVARLKLESRDIECYLLDENLISTDWLFANAAGGIKLQVRRSDAPAAAATLIAPAIGRPFEHVEHEIAPAFATLTCPCCGSADVYRESVWRTTGWVLTAAVVMSFGFLLLPALPWLLRKPRPWTCLDCGEEFLTDHTGAFPVLSPSDDSGR